MKNLSKIENLAVAAIVSKLRDLRLFNYSFQRDIQNTGMLEKIEKSVQVSDIKEPVLDVSVVKAIYSQNKKISFKELMKRKEEIVIFLNLETAKKNHTFKIHMPTKSISIINSERFKIILDKINEKKELMPHPDIDFVITLRRDMDEFLVEKEIS